MPREIPEVMIDVVIAEALGEGDDGIAQVAQVMFNRADARGQTLKEVVTAPAQFEGYKSPGREIKKAMDNEQVRNRVREIIRQVDYGEREVAYPNADHFHTPKVNPSWANDESGNIKRDGKLGNHIFYSTPQSTTVATRRAREREELGLTPPENIRIAAPTPPDRSPNVPDRPQNLRADQPQQAFNQSDDPIGDLITANSYAPEDRQNTTPAVEGIEKAFGTSRSPFTSAGRQAIDESRSATLAYNNKAAKRNLTVKQQLENDIIDAVTDVYGPDYKVSVISGRQEKGVSRGIVGSRRHNTAAADVHVYDSEGKRVTGDDLVPLAQYWLASEKGSIGFPAKPGQSMHMDLFGGTGEGAEKLRGTEGKLWYYGKPTPSQRKTLSAGRDQKTMPSVLAKNAPRPPEASAADRARRASLTQTSNLNTPDESDQASRFSTGNPRVRESIFKQGNKTVVAPQSSQGDPNVMAQFQSKPAPGPLTGGENIPIYARTNFKRPYKQDEIDGPATASIGTFRDTGAPSGATIVDRPSPTAPEATAVDTPTADPAKVEPVTKKDDPNLLEQGFGYVGDRINDATSRARRNIASLQTGLQNFASDPIGTFRQRGSEVGERVRDRLQPLAQALEGPDYSAADQSVREGFQNDGYGSNLIAVGPQGTRRVNVSRSDTDRERDAEMHPGQNMEAYRANKAVFQKYGLPMTSSNSKKLLEMGETLYVPRESENKYGRSRGSSGGSNSSPEPTPTRQPRQRRRSTPTPQRQTSAIDSAREQERERRREQRRREREEGRNSGI